MNTKQLIKAKCANYQGGMCLPRDIECPLVTSFVYRGHTMPCSEVTCNYLEVYVLGRKERDSGPSKTVYSYKPCKRCGNEFRPSSRGNRYCSGSCKDKAYRESHRKYNAKR